MKRQRKSRPQTPPVCAELHEDDCVDPRTFFRSRSHRDDRKTLQLCKQVLRILSVIFSGECREHILREVEPRAVIPAADSSRLLVQVQLTPSAPEIASDTILQALKRAQPWLRAEVAAAVSRKRVPDLVFEVHPREGNTHER